MTRLTNLAIALLRSDKGLTSAQIAESVEGYSPYEPRDTFDKRFRRDRLKLEMAGLPVSTDDGFPRRYRIERSEVTQGDITLNFKDRCALSVAVQAALSDEGFFLKEELLNASRKLGIDLPADESLIADKPDLTGIAKLIAEAKSRSRAISFEYESANSEDARLRTALPLSLFTYHGDWYLSAMDTDIDELRTFKLERMANVDIGESANTDLPTANPILFPFQIGAESFDAKIYIGESRNAEIESITWSKGTTEACGRGIVWTIEAKDSNALASWVLENGPGILLLEPKRIAQSIEAHLHSVLESLEVRDD